MAPRRQHRPLAAAAVCCCCCLLLLAPRVGSDCAVAGVTYTAAVITAGCEPALCTDAAGVEVAAVDACTAADGTTAVVAATEILCVYTDKLWDAVADPPVCTTADGTASVAATDQADCTLTGNTWTSAQAACTAVTEQSWRPADVILSSTGSTTPSRCAMTCPAYHVLSGTQPGCTGRILDTESNDPITCTPVATCGDRDGAGSATDAVSDDDCGIGFYYSEDADHKCVGVFCNLLHVDDLAGCCRECELLPRAADSASYTCTSPFDSHVSGCMDGFYKMEGGDGVADNCTSCSPIPYHAADGQVKCAEGASSWVTPATPYSSTCAHGYYRESVTTSTDGELCNPHCSGWGVLVAGGGDDGTVGSGNDADRFDQPTFFTLHEDGNGTTTLHVSDKGNMRVVKWVVGSSVGSTVVPRREDNDHIRTSLGTPYGVAVANGFVYVAEQDRHRVLKWKEGAGWCRVTDGNTKCPGGFGMVNQRQTRDSCEEHAIGISAISYSFIQEEDTGYAAFDSPEFCGVTHPDTGEDACIRDLLPNCQIMQEHCVGTEQGSQAMDWRMYGQCGLPVAGKEYDVSNALGSYETGSLEESASPTGIFVTETEDAYVSDKLNDRIVRWSPGDPQVRLVSTQKGTTSSITMQPTSDSNTKALFGSGVPAGGACPVACPSGVDRQNGVEGTYTGVAFEPHDFSEVSEVLRLTIDGVGTDVLVTLTSNMHSVTATVDALNLIQQTKLMQCRALSCGSPAAFCESSCEAVNGCRWDPDNGQNSQKCGVMWRAETTTTGEKVAGGTKCRLADDCTTLRMLDDPQGVLVKGTDLYIVDSGNHRVVKWPIGAAAATQVIAGTGTAGDGLDELDTPMGIAMDWTGALYIADANNNRVMRWTDGGTTGTQVAGSPQGDPGNGLNSLTAPTDVNLDYAGNLYISDTGNHRIVMWCATGVTDLKCELPPDGNGETVKAWPNGVRMRVNSTLTCDHPYGGGFGDVCDLGCLPDWTPSDVTRGHCVHAGTTSRNHFIGHGITCTAPGSGCTDPLATNFDPAATVDDDTCVLPDPFPWWVIVVVVLLLGGGAGAYEYQKRRKLALVDVVKDDVESEESEPEQEQEPVQDGDEPIPGVTYDYVVSAQRTLPRPLRVHLF